MAKDPIRAFRVDDALWMSALTRAQQDDVSLSSVIREALRAYVGDSEEQRSAVIVPPDEALRDADDEHAFVLLPLLDSTVLARAQGIVMVRHGCDPAQASAHLERAARACGLSVQAFALQLVTSASEPSGAGREHGAGAEVRGTDSPAPVRPQTS